MPVSSIGPSDSASTHRANAVGVPAESATADAGPSPSPMPDHPVSQLLDSRVSSSAPNVSRAIKRAEHGDSAPQNGHSPSLGDQVAGFAHGAAEATGSMVGGMWNMAKGAAKLSPASYAAEKLSDATGLNAYHGFSETAASAKQTVHAIAANPGGVLKAAVEPYRSAWQAGKYGEAIGMGTVDAASFLADGLGEAGKLGDAASAAGKLGEGAGAAEKLAEGASAAAPSISAATNDALAPAARTAAATRPANTTRHGVIRTNTADWRALRDHWDQLGYGEILSDGNRSAIAKGRTPKVDDAWISVFPEDAGLKGERISMHHIGGSPVTVPLPATRHLDAHMPGGFRHNPGGPGSALPFYPPKPTGE